MQGNVESPDTTMAAAEEPGIPDVTGMSMLDLLSSGDPEISESLRDLLADWKVRRDVVASWSSFLR